MYPDTSYTVGVASHIFNFFSERMLETFGKKALVVHVGKAFGIEREFDDTWVKESWATGNTPLAVAVDAMISRVSSQEEKFFVVLDHDIAWTKNPDEVITGVIREMVAYSADVAMSGAAHPMSPFVVCRVGSPLLAEGCFRCDRTGPMNAFLDTGRRMIDENRSKVHLFGDDPVGIHVGSAWLRDRHSSLADLADCCSRMRLGGFEPSEAELPIIREHFSSFYEAYSFSKR